ncbi:MAG: tRNA 2-thiouridine(34) synthase MnmA [bacterium]|nr:tRNA 2-thiouridine(34) synthase MnmA [bacterium]
MIFPLPIPEDLRWRLEPGTRVLLGLSGGVDSAVSLALLHALDCDVQCVTFKNFCYGDAAEEAGEKSCCSLDAIDEARRLAARFAAPHWVGNVEDAFRQAVIDPFVAEYQAARTPNPCLHCNGTVRFPELVRLADRQGCTLAATGHYARVRMDDDGARLLRGADPGKDQAYFLHRVDRSVLARVVFPLGWFVKADVRRAARELDLRVASRPDSQEICFVPDDDRSFLFTGAGAPRPGEIVDRDGQVLGEHRGLVHYTVGQRRGLGVAAPEPLYVLELRLAENRLVVGPQSALDRDRLLADDFVAAVPDLPAEGATYGGVPVTARIRHRHQGAAVARWRLQGGRLVVELAEPVSGAAPGQGLVLYAEDLVLGGGRLRETSAEKETA